MIYVYAIAESPSVPPVPGLGGSPLRAVGVEGLRAVVSDHERAPESNEDALWRHESVVEALMEDGDVLPMRFGMLVADESGVQALLHARREEFESALARVRGAVELSVRARIEPGGGPMNEFAAAAEPGGGPGTAYLRVRLDESRRAEEAVDRIHGPLSRLARSAARGRSAPPGTLKSAYLVDRGRVEAFGAQVEELAEEVDGAAIACTGPWPPYSFVQEAAG
ncbi:MAG: GvpL/GvpF family gas vesicle protein [Solirubrobacterales bacterium]